MQEDSNIFNNKIKKILIDEKHDTVTYYMSDGRILSTILSDILNRKNEIFINFKISQKCHELTTSIFKRRKLQKILNPVIIEGLNDNIDIMEYIKCVKNQSKLSFELEHNTVDSRLNLFDKLKMKKIARNEKILGAQVHIVDENIFDIIKKGITKTIKKSDKKEKEKNVKKEKGNISIVSEKDVDQKCEEIRNFLKDYYANINGELENIRDSESAEHNLKVAINWYINNQKNDKANANMKVFRKLLDTERKHFYEPNIIRELDKKNRNSVTRYMEELSIKNYELQKLKIRNLLSMGRIDEAKEAYKKTLEVLGITLNSKEMKKSLKDGIEYGYYYTQENKGFKKNKIKGNETILKNVEILEKARQESKSTKEEQKNNANDNSISEEKNKKDIEPKQEKKIYSRKEIVEIIQKCDKFGNKIKFKKAAIIPVISALISYLKVNKDKQVQEYLNDLLTNFEQIEPIDLLKEKEGKEYKYNVLILDYLSNLYKDGILTENDESIIANDEKKYSYYMYLLNRRIEDNPDDCKLLGDDKIRKIKEEYSANSENIEFNYFEELVEKNKKSCKGLESKLIKAEKYSQAVQELENNSNNDCIRLLALSEDLQNGVYRKRVGLPTNLKTYTDLREMVIRKIALNQLTNPRVLKLIADIENKGIYDKFENEIVKPDKNIAQKIYPKLPTEFNPLIEKKSEEKNNANTKETTEPKKKSSKNFFKKKKHTNKEEKLESEKADEEKNIYVCSDLHGQFELYKIMLNQIKNGEKLYILGDVIDRGPDGIKILQDILQNKDRIEFFVGNHELMMIQSLFFGNEIERKNWISESNGGRKTQEDFLRLSSEEQEKIKELLLQSTVHSEINVDGERIYLVHAKADKSNEKKKEVVKDYLNENRINELFNCVWARIGDTKAQNNPEEIWQEDDIAKENVFTVIGHTPTDDNKIAVHNSYVVIDCGATNYGNGCLLRLNDGKPVYFDNVTRCLEQLKNEEER